LDNSKIKSAVPEYKATIPFEQGAAEIAEWYDAHPEYQIVNHNFDAMLDKIFEDYDKMKTKKGE
jgi:pterin-4a-carbinolamine dehydratase